MGVFRARFVVTFASVVHKEKAEALLETRMQLPNENVALFTKEMTKLFRHTDPEMSLNKKVHLLMRGAQRELLAGLMWNPSNGIQEFVSEATTIEKTLEMHHSTAARRQAVQRSSHSAPTICVKA